jgi:hypothetical protein
MDFEVHQVQDQVRASARRSKKQEAGARSGLCFVTDVILCVLHMCTHAAATSNCRLQQLNTSLPTAATTAGVTIDITIATAPPQLPQLVLPHFRSLTDAVATAAMFVLRWRASVIIVTAVTIVTVFTTDVTSPSLSVRPSPLLP